MYSVHMSSNLMRSIDSFYASLLESRLTDGEHHRVLEKDCLPVTPTPGVLPRIPSLHRLWLLHIPGLCVVAIQGSNILLYIHTYHSGHVKHPSAAEPV